MEGGQQQQQQQDYSQDGNWDYNQGSYPQQDGTYQNQQQNNWDYDDQGYYQQDYGQEDSQQYQDAPDQTQQQEQPTAAEGDTAGGPQTADGATDGEGGATTSQAWEAIEKIKCNSGAMKLYIVSQEKKSGHVEYRIKGSDSIGDIDVSRRYREFDQFRDLIFNRYPGLVIPAIPPKQVTGNKEESFVEERKYFLDIFLSSIASISYLANSPELQLFLRPQGKVEESLKSLPRTNTDIVLNYFKTKVVLPMDMDKVPESQLHRLQTDIQDFVKEQKMLMEYLKNFREHIARIVPMKEQELKYYQQFADFLQKYEDGSAKTSDKFSKSVAGVRLVSGESKAHLKNKLDELSQQLLNPFIHVRNWVKAEMLALETLMAAISEKEACDVRKQSAIKRLKEDRELTAKLSQGKFTLKGMFKSKNGKARQQAAILEKIAQHERDIDNWNIIKKFLIIYLAEVAIPEFRNRKVSRYIQAMGNFSLEELQNAKKHQMCWGDFFELTKVLSEDQK